MAADKDTHFLNGRAYDCQIIPNATDKPLELWMHHFHSMALIVNKETGDVCSQFFSDNRNDGAQRIFDGSPVRNLQQDVFLEQPGEKVVFLFNTNYKSPNVSKYLSDLEEKNVIQGGGIDC